MNNVVNIINLNNISYNVIKTHTILQLADYYFIEIPKFCYHQKLSIAGNCRMCLVEIEGIKKPIASCALPVSSNMNILTKSQLVKKAREGILEFLLINHPLDCPICDQGGECDLQEQSFNFGTDKGRFYELKRSVINKECGPFIKTIMTRCIHCTRCVRYLNEIAGISNLGIIGRGVSMEISNYLNKTIVSELSGNVIDLCPVGALTSKPYSFTARVWELESVETISILDPFLPNIRIDLRDRKIMRILPRYNPIIEESWITDICRFSYDSFLTNRLNFPYFSEIFFSKKMTWLGVFNKLNSELQTAKLFFILGNFLDAETLFLLKQIIKKKGNALAFLTSNEVIKNIDFRNYYLWEYNSSAIKLLQTLINIGVNLRYDVPFFNLKLKQIKNQNLNFYLISWGTTADILQSYYSLGFHLKHLIDFFFGKNRHSKKLITSNTQILVSHTISNLFLVSTIYFLFQNWYKILKKNKKMQFLNSFSTLSSLNNVLPYEFNLFNNSSKIEDFTYDIPSSNSYDNVQENYINYFLNTSELKIFQKTNKKIINLYQGHHSFSSLTTFNYILPSTFFLEKNALYLNILGFAKLSQFVLTPPKQARNDLQILLIFFLNYLCTYNAYMNDFNFYEILKYIRKSLNKLSPLFSTLHNKKKMKKYIMNNVFFNQDINNVLVKNFFLLHKYFKQSQLVNFWSPNHLVNLSLNVNLANQQSLYYFSSFQ